MATLRNSRRAFLAAASPVLAGGGWGAARLLGGLGGAESEGLTPARRRTFAAVAGAVASVPGAPEGASPRRASRTLAAHYRTASVQERARIDDILDAVGGCARGGFHRLTADERVAALCAAAAPRGEAGAKDREAGVALALAAARRRFDADAAHPDLWLRTARALPHARQRRAPAA